MIVAVIALAALSAALAGTLVVRSGYRLRRPRPGARRILIPFTGGTLERTVLDAAIRIAQAEDATLVPAYLLLVPLRYAEDSPLADEVRVAMPWLEAVEHAAHRAGVPVDARIEKGRTPTHALQRLWAVEGFDRVIAPAPVSNGGGFSPKDLTWILAHAPAETLVLRPTPTDTAHRPATQASGTLPATRSDDSQNGRPGSRNRSLHAAASSAQPR